MSGLPSDSSTTSNFLPPAKRIIAQQRDKENGTVGGPKKKRTKRQDDAGSRHPPSEPFSNPKNFPERLMNGLEGGIASESVFWADNGKAIGVYKESLEFHPKLGDFYKARDYSGFIRNCNRWGFSRVNVDQGVSYYRNSLFQRGMPHLLKFMKMDSDVQAVFADYLRKGGSIQANPNELAKIYASSCGRKGSKSSSSTHQEQQQPAGIVGKNTTTTGRGSMTVHVGCGSTNNKIDDAVADAALVVSQASAAAAAEANNNLSKEFILRKILQLTDQFLNHHGSLFADDEAFKMTLQRLQAQGQQHEQDLTDKGQMNDVYRLEGSLKTTTSTAGTTTCETVPSSSAVPVARVSPPQPASPQIPPHQPAPPHQVLQQISQQQQQHHQAPQPANAGHVVDAVNLVAVSLLQNLQQRGGGGGGGKQQQQNPASLQVLSPQRAPPPPPQVQPSTVIPQQLQQHHHQPPVPPLPPSNDAAASALQSLLQGFSQHQQQQQFLAPQQPPPPQRQHQQAPNQPAAAPVAGLVQLIHQLKQQQ